MSIYSIGVSALRTAQLGMSITGHNIANANTEGYRRQEAVQGTNTPIVSGNGFIGQGVNTSTVRRIYDTILERQVSQSETQSAYQDQFLQDISQLDNVLGDRTAGLSSVLQNFFKSWNDLSNDPSSTAARQAVLGAANTVSNSINSMGNYLQTLQSGINSDISAMVSQVNSYAASIASLNEGIKNVQVSDLQPANDMLDQRDRVVAQLNKLVGVSVIKDTVTGDYNVFMGGTQLVAGSRSVSLIAATSRFDQGRTEVYDASGKISLSENSQIGGQLGAVLDYRSDVLDLTQNSYGRIAIAMADSVNALHTSGRDSTGTLGGVFFTSPNSLPQAFPSTGNTSTATVTPTINNASQLTTSDYQLSFDGTNYKLTRMSDGTSWSNANIATLATTAGQGFSLSISSAPNAGDTFLIRPTAAAASNVSVAITDPALIAAASGASAAGDTLNNANALAIAALESDRSLIAGNNTLESAYSVLVNGIGNKTSETKIVQKVQKNILDQAQQAQQAASGVNLDEEAANLIRNQQAYQAAAQVLKTATTLFDTLLTIGG